MPVHASSFLCLGLDGDNNDGDEYYDDHFVFEFFFAMSQVGLDCIGDK